jgi:hypothetical protein
MSMNPDDFQGQTKMFWGEIAPREHLVQFYEDEQVFLDTLEGFVGGGLKAGDSIILIAVATHIKALEDRLKANGLDVEAARSQNQYIAEEAEAVLAKFMANSWPDEELFIKVITELLGRARGHSPKVRAFGEMVAVLWARGDTGATVRLEYLWHNLCQTEGFSLFCAYPRVGFTQDSTESLNEICATHSKVIPS